MSIRLRPLTLKQQRVLDFVTSNPGATTPEIVKACGLGADAGGDAVLKSLYVKFKVVRIKGRLMNEPTRWWAATIRGAT